MSESSISFTSLLDRHALILGDGAMGSMLIDLGMKLGDCAERWNLEQPDCITRIHRRYIESGSDFIQTHTFGANPFRLAPHDLHSQTDLINQTAVQLAQAALQAHTFILGTIGPSGLVPEPVGPATFTELEDGFRMQAKALIDAGVNGILIETMMYLDEALSALRAVRSVRDDLPVIVSLCFQYKQGSYQTAFGETPQKAAGVLTDSGATVIGANCMFSFEHYAEITDQLRQGTSLPILVQPNAGQPIQNNGGVTYPMTPEQMIKSISDIVASGATILGGCCGTTPAHIAALREWIDRKNETSR